MYCPRCGLGQPADHWFCVSCRARLPGELLPPVTPKVSRWFRSVPIHPDDRPENMLRVSRYLKEFEIDTEDGSVRIPAHHVRFSIWSGDAVQCVVSIPDDEARSLADFLATIVDETEEHDSPSSAAVE